MQRRVAITVELRAGAANLEAALSALSPGSLAMELLGAESAPILLALFPGADPEGTERLLRARLVEHGLGALPLSIRPGKALASWTCWHPEHRGLQVGPLWITPPGLRPPAGVRLRLELESQSAFGSGMHETTQLCLERILELSPTPALFDLGTGSGVLSLSALRLGAPRAVGTDIDPQAVECAVANARRNGLHDRFQAGAEPPEVVGGEHALVVANVIAHALIALAPRLAPRVAPGGRLLLSGLRGHELGAVAEAYAAHGLRRGPEASRGTWARLELAR